MARRFATTCKLAVVGFPDIPLAGRKRGSSELQQAGDARVNGLPRMCEMSCSLDPTHPLGNIASAVIESLEMRWSGVTRSIMGFSDSMNRFSGDFFESSATINVTARTLTSTGHGFRFVSSATTKVNFAQFGRETNGVFF